MIKKTLCTVFSAMFLFVSIPTFAASSKYKESKHFILDIEDKYLKGNISNKKLKKWLGNLDSSYEALEELYGKPESTKKIRIKSATLDGATRFFYDYDEANHDVSPLIEWCNDNRDDCVRSTLKRFDHGDESFAVALSFAISYFFSGINRSYSGWCFDRDTLNQLSVEYLADCTDSRLSKPNDGLYSSSPSYTFKSMASKLMELKDKIGSWEPFKKAFRAFSSGSIDEIRDYSYDCEKHSNEMHCYYSLGASYLNPLRRFKAFMNELSKQGYSDEVNNLFTPSQMDAIESYLNQKEY